MSTNTDKKIISFELPFELYDKIKAAASKDDRSLSSYLRKVLNAAANADLSNTSF